MGDSGVPFVLYRVVDRRLASQPIPLPRLTTSFGRVMTNIILSTPVDHVCDVILLGLSDTALRVHVFADNSEVYINNRRLAQRGMYTLEPMQLLRVCSVTFLVVRGALPADADAVVEAALDAPLCEDASAEDGESAEEEDERHGRGSEPHAINQMLRTSASLREKENRPSQRRSVRPSVQLDATSEGSAEDEEDDESAEEERGRKRRKEARRKKGRGGTRRSRSASRRRTPKRRRRRSETSSDEEEDDEAKRADRRRAGRKRARRAAGSSESWSDAEEAGRGRRRGRGRASSDEDDAERRPKRARRAAGAERGRARPLSQAFRAKVFFFGENERLLEKHAAAIQERGGKAVLGYPRFPHRGVCVPDDGRFHTDAVVAENRNAFLIVDPRAVGNVLPYLLCFIAQVPVLRADFVAALAADDAVSPADFFVHSVPNHPELDLPQPFVFVPHDPPIVNRRPDPVRIQVLFRDSDAQQAAHAGRSGGSRLSIRMAAADTANTREWARALIHCIGARLVDRPLGSSTTEKPVYNFVPCEPAAAGVLPRRRASLAKQKEVHMDWVVAMLQARQFIDPDAIINAPCDHSEYSAL